MNRGSEVIRTSQKGRTYIPPHNDLPPMRSEFTAAHPLRKRHTYPCTTRITRAGSGSPRGDCRPVSGTGKNTRHLWQVCIPALIVRQRLIVRKKLKSKQGLLRTLLGTVFCVRFTNAACRVARRQENSEPLPGDKNLVF